MSEQNGNQSVFWGTYFDRDNVLRLTRWAEILAWVILSLYMISWLLSIVLLLSQYFNGMFFDKGTTFLNVFGMFKPYFVEPVPGVLYFFGLQGISKVLLIMLDVEDNTRRAAKK